MKKYELATINDAKELYDLQLRAFESEAEMIGSRDVPALLESYDDFAQDFSNWTVLIKRNDEGRIIGSARYKKVDNYVEIGRLMVAPENRKQGIAIEIMKAVEEISKGNTFQLFTCTKSYINIRLYKKLGYHVYKEEKGNRDISFVYMRKHMISLS